MITTLIGLLIVMPIVVGFAVHNLAQPVPRRHAAATTRSSVVHPPAAPSFEPLSNAVEHPPKPHPPQPDHGHGRLHGKHDPGHDGNQNEDD